MALTAQQLTYLRTADQRFRARVGIFAKYEPTVTAPDPGSGEALAPTPILRCAPRYQLADNGETVNLYGTDSYNRGGAYVGNANISFALDAGSSGSVTDGGDGTATYEAPGAGSGIAQINITVTNGNGSKTGYAFVQYPSTTYDAIVAEIASISAGIDQHGYKMTLRARGDVGDFALGKGILLHVEDTWAGVESTFGGYQYQEGVFYGYITEMEYFEDAAGETWLGVEVQSPWWLLGKTPVGETYWGYTAASGRFYIGDFRPVDALWHFLNEITDFSLYHDCVLWYDQNSIDDFIIDESDLATITADVMARTLSITYCDRYGSLFCIPDPDVRADEWWGTPAPQYTGTEILTPNLTTDYTIRRNDYKVRKLTLAAFDRSKRGIFAISENNTALGSKEEIRGLLCDQGITLASWAVQKRAQMNRQWEIDVSLPLNHTMDLCNFADVNFTAPGQLSALTASGRTWLASLAYRPNVFDGGWIGRWTLLNQTEGQGEAETGASAWGGAGEEYSAILAGNEGGWDPGGWLTPNTEPTWCYLFDFVNSGAQNWLVQTTQGNYLAAGGMGTLMASGWQADTAVVTGGPQSGDTAHIVNLYHFMVPRTITGMKAWASGTASGDSPQAFVRIAAYTGGSAGTLVMSGQANVENLIGTAQVSGTATADILQLLLYFDDPNPADLSITAYLKSAMVAGLGANPFGLDNCP